MQSFGRWCNAACGVCPDPQTRCELRAVQAGVGAGGLSGSYPARARVARNVANGRQVITIIELDVPAGEFRAASSSLTRADALARLADIVESTELEGVYEDIFDENSLPG